MKFQIYSCFNSTRNRRCCRYCFSHWQGALHWIFLGDKCVVAFFQQICLGEQVSLVFNNRPSNFCSILQMLIMLHNPHKLNCRKMYSNNKLKNEEKNCGVKLLHFFCCNLSNHSLYFTPECTCNKVIEFSLLKSKHQKVEGQKKNSLKDLSWDKSMYTPYFKMNQISSLFKVKIVI